MERIAWRFREQAARVVLEPFVKVELQPERYGYRPDRSALDAAQALHGLLNAGRGNGR